MGIFYVAELHTVVCSSKSHFLKMTRTKTQIRLSRGEPMMKENVKIAKNKQFVLLEDPHHTGLRILKKRVGSSVKILICRGFSREERERMSIAMIGRFLNKESRDDHIRF